MSITKIVFIITKLITKFVQKISLLIELRVRFFFLSIYDLKLIKEHFESKLSIYLQHFYIVQLHINYSTN